MKGFKKSTAIVLMSLLSVIMIIGFLFSYVPMGSGSKTFVSFLGSINVSSDITGGMYGEFNIKSENPSKKDLVDSMQKIKQVFEEDGYKNVNVYALGKEKIRVEVSHPRGSKSYGEVYSELLNLGTGAFQLRSAQTVDEKTVVLEGSKHVKEIKVFTNNDVKYIQIFFNKEGQEVYKKLIKAGQSGIYIALGTETQQIPLSSTNVPTDSLTLSDPDYPNLIKLEQKVKLGCMKVQLDGATSVINTMSASLTAGESASRPEFKSFTSSTALVVSVSALIIVFVLTIVLFALKFGFFSILIAVSMLFNSYLFIILMTLMPSVEFGLSGILALMLGISIVYTYAYIFVSQVKKNYELGKSISASLEHTYKSTLPNFLIGNVMLFLMSLVMFALSFGELTSATIIFASSIALSFFTNLLFIPFLIKIAISFKGAGTKLFMLKRRSMETKVVEIEDENIDIKEAE